MEHFVILHKLDDEQFQSLVDLLAASGDPAKLSDITKQLRASQKNLSAAIDANKPDPSGKVSHNPNNPKSQGEQ